MMPPEDLRKRDDEDLRWVASTPEGRRFLNRVINGLAGAIKPAFAGERTHVTANREGRRWVGLRLIAEMQRVAPAEWVHMLREAVDHQRRMKAAAEEVDDDAGRE